MAFFTDCRRWRWRWQCHQPLFLCNTWSNSLLLLVPKRVVSYCGVSQRKVSGRRSGVRKIGPLYRDIQSKLKTRRSVHNRLSQFGSSSAFSDGGETKDYQSPFNLDLAVLLAGFAFESYNTPAKNVGVLEVDGGGCETIYLSREYINSIYDGQLFVKLTKGIEFPGLDLWGTSDPYVVLRIGDCCVRSRTIWATRDPVWNENLALNVKTSAGQNLQVAAWDANVVTSHRRMGNTSVSLENLCDGKEYSLELSLGGMGGGGRLFLEVQFKSFAQIEAEKNQFSIAGLFGGEALANAYKAVFGENGISVGEFMSDFMSKLNTGTDSSTSAKEDHQLSKLNNGGVSDPELPKDSRQTNEAQKETSDKPKDGDLVNKAGHVDDDGESDTRKSLAESFSQTLKPFGIDLSGVLKDIDAWEVGEDVKSLGLKSQKRAEFLYADSGLAVIDDAQVESAITSNTKADSDLSNGEPGSGEDSDSLPVGKQMLEGLIEHTEGIVGTWALFNKSQGEQQSNGQEEAPAEESGTERTTMKTSTENEKADPRKQEDVDTDVDEGKTTMFSTAESAMEAWALLATTVGGVSLVKSDFEKVCFVENAKTDTQAVVWRDLRRQRLVVAFRGTEQTKWQDVVTDISLLPAGFNPERVAAGNNLRGEPLVHSGFLKAYDSVKSRMLSLVRASIESSIESGYDNWHIYVTGHSLGGALATLFAFELSTSKLAKNRDLQVTMYNYGSPRVGDKKFADNYNNIVKDSWRVVNHRDIVPTVPRLMGYCHVAQPIYLAADESPVSDLLDDGYRGDVLGEATAEVIIDKFMKGEQTLLQKLLETEISMLRAMRDGSAVMQHMEDFYYISLLQVYVSFPPAGHLLPTELVSPDGNQEQVRTIARRLLLAESRCTSTQPSHFNHSCHFSNLQEDVVPGFQFWSCRVSR